MARQVNAQMNNAPQITQEEVRTPLYHQIYLILRNKIFEGEYPNGAFLPSEQELARAFNVSRITAKRALNEIAAQGLAVRERGRGTRISYDSNNRIVQGSVRSLINSQMVNGGRNVVKVLEFEYIPAPPDVAKELQLERGTVLQRAVRMWHRNGEPYSHLTTYIPSSIGQTYTMAMMSKKSLAALFIDAGIEVHRVDQTITATLADSVIAAKLNTAVGAPLLRIFKTAYDPDDQPVEHMIALYPADRYHVQMRLVENDEAMDEP